MITKFAQEYLDDVSKLCHAIMEEKNLNTYYDLKRLNANMPCDKFLFEKQYLCKYTFHGRGCRVESQYIEIDWDFGYDDNFCGLDPWKLAYYIRDNKDDTEWNDGEKIKKVFNEWVATGKMIVKYGLYYFTK